MPSDGRPNILLIMSDQHHPHIMGCEGDPVVRTPNLDRLAERGALFENCYCPSALCVPSRMSFMTSRYPSGNEVWTNGCHLSSDIPTFAHSLGAAGYESLLIGRMHFVGPDQRHGFERRLVGDVCSPYIGGPLPALTEEIFPGAGFNRKSFDLTGGGRTGYQIYDEQVAGEAADYLKVHAGTPADERRPFCAVVGFVLPHCPFICPEEDSRYYEDKVTLPEPADRYPTHPAIQLWQQTSGVEDLPQEKARRARAAYYGLVTHFDRQVGTVLDVLEQSGLAKDTVVIYVSDHGEMAGEHGLWWKLSHYEGSASVPLIVTWPGRIEGGRRLNQVVNLTDIGATMIDIGGGAPLPNTVGRSLLPLLDGEPIEWEDETFCECCPYEALPASRMVRRGPWKLVYYAGFRPILFNLDADPNELHDLGEDPAHAEIVRDLTARVLDGWSPSHIEETVSRRMQSWGVLAQWYTQVQPENPDLWYPPAE